MDTDDIMEFLYIEQGKASYFYHRLSYYIILLETCHWDLNSLTMRIEPEHVFQYCTHNIAARRRHIQLFTVHMCIVSKSIVSQPKFSIRIISWGMRIVTPQFLPSLMKTGLSSHHDEHFCQEWWNTQRFSPYHVHKLISIYVHCDLDLWPLTSTINRVHPCTMANMSAKFDQETHNGLVSIVFTSLFPYTVKSFIFVGL